MKIFVSLLLLIVSGWCFSKILLESDPEKVSDVVLFEGTVFDLECEYSPRKHNSYIDLFSDAGKKISFMAINYKCDDDFISSAKGRAFAAYLREEVVVDVKIENYRLKSYGSYRRSVNVMAGMTGATLILFSILIHARTWVDKFKSRGQSP